MWLVLKVNIYIWFFVVVMMMSALVPGKKDNNYIQVPTVIYF